MKTVAMTTRINRIRRHSRSVQADCYELSFNLMKLFFKLDYNYTILPDTMIVHYFTISYVTITK